MDSPKENMPSNLKPQTQNPKSSNTNHYLQNLYGVPLFIAKCRGVVEVPTNGDIPRLTSYLYPSFFFFKSVKIPRPHRPLQSRRLRIVKPEGRNRFVHLSQVICPVTNSLVLTKFWPPSILSFSLCIYFGFPTFCGLSPSSCLFHLSPIFCSVVGAF